MNLKIFHFFFNEQFPWAMGDGQCHPTRNHIPSPDAALLPFLRMIRNVNYRRTARRTGFIAEVHAPHSVVFHI
jgi:hypothetical protein